MTTISSRPDVVNLNLYSGDAFSYLYTVTDSDTGLAIDVTNSVFLVQFREQTSSATVLAEGVVTKVTPAAGEIKLDLTGEQVATLAAYTAFQSRQGGVWDLQHTDELLVPTTLLRGRVKILPDVSRSA